MIRKNSTTELSRSESEGRKENEVLFDIARAKHLVL